MLTDLSTPQSFLLIRFSSLGDVLLLTPALRALRRVIPTARLDVLTKERYGELLAANPQISNLILFPDDGGKAELAALAERLRGCYDVVVDLHTSLRSACLRRRLQARQVVAYRKCRWARFCLVHFKLDLYPGEFSVPLAYLEALKPWGVSDDGGGLEWRNAELQRDRFLQIAGLTTPPLEAPIALCPGAAHAAKRWQLPNWQELARRLLEQGKTLWIFGDQADRKSGEALQALDEKRVCNFCGRLSLAESGAGLSFCRAAVTHDAGPLHMAAAARTPVVAIFGPTTTQLGFRPFRTPQRIVEVKMKCRPCSPVGPERCPLAHHLCMREITVSQVLQLLDDLLVENRESNPSAAQPPLVVGGR